MKTTEAKEDKTSSKKAPQTWSRRISKNDITEEIEVTEAENGFIVTHSKSGYKGTGNNKEWYHDCKKYISKENPLDEEEEKPFSEALEGILHEIDEQNGQIDVD